MESCYHEFFSGRNVAVTGATRGIGKAIAKSFAVHGANVAISSRQYHDSRKAVLDIKCQYGGLVLPLQLDVRKQDRCESFIKEVVKGLGGIDVLVNNAAEFNKVTLLDVSEYGACEMFKTNVLGPLFCSEAVASYAMQNRKECCIINISSISAERPAKGYGLYAATKAALNTITRSASIEWAAHGIRVNCIAPGHVDTESIRGADEKEELSMEGIKSDIPIGELTSEKSIADLVLFLSSPAAKHIVGQVITIDGGQSLNI